MTDRELVEKVNAGEDDAYAELIRRHHGQVMALCVSMLGDEASAEDAAQEAFLKAHASLADFRGDAAFSTWLYRIAANKCLDHRRASSRRRSQSLDALLEDGGEPLHALLAEPGPERAAERAQLVEQVLSELPLQYRIALTLRELNGLTYEEIAASMECSVDSVKARLQRARRELLGRLRHSAAGEDV